MKITLEVIRNLISKNNFTESQRDMLANNIRRWRELKRERCEACENEYGALCAVGKSFVTIVARGEEYTLNLSTEDIANLAEIYAELNKL